jgi:hypothetical protein
MRMKQRPDLIGRIRVHLLVAALGAIAGANGLAIAGEGPETAPQIRAARDRFFEQNVRPVLVESCFSCHSSSGQKGGLRLDSLEAILRGGDSGPALVPGKPAESLLVEAINYDGPEMPPAGKLTPEKIDVLTRWVSLGAQWPARDGNASHAALRGDLSGKSGDMGTGGRSEQPPLWSFRPIRRPEIPDVRGGSSPAGADWATNPVDRFILRKLADHDLSPAPPADGVTLIRRVTFDLTGLPPTPEDVATFLSDDRPDAYDRLVDRLLASPRYGQRWARHWLDLVRYAESDGFRQDAFRPDAWRYRDYVVHSFDADKPYDRFVSEQLAGDEIDPDDPELRVATGYLRLWPYEYNQRNVAGQWADILNDVTDVTGEVFLGMSIGCARCHDHKFDPILQEDYYRLQAFFAPLMPRDDLPFARPREWEDYRRRHEAWQKEAADVLREMDAIARPYQERGTASALAKFQDDIRAVLARPEAERTPLERQIGALAYRQVAYEHAQVPATLKGRDKLRWAELQATLTRHESLKPKEPGTVLAATDVGPVSPPTVIPGARRRGAIEPGFPRALDPSAARIQAPPSAPRSTGRRLALARWLGRPDHPLSTRVIVNRIWQYHFGRGLAGTPSDFGRLGEPPSHPELLDWLASEFVAGGWRWKPMHRLIVTSAVYRQSSHRPLDEVVRAARIDPQDRLLWKQSVRRLDAEEIRDAMLAASGELDPRMGGPSDDPSRTRRTIETRIVRNAPDALLSAFDAPDGSGSTPRRDTTTTSTQALMLLNGPWTLARARSFTARVERLTAGSAGQRDRIALAYRLAMARPADPAEVEEGAAFVRRVDGGEGSPMPVDHRAGLVDFCHVLLNSNEFLYID